MSSKQYYAPVLFSAILLLLSGCHKKDLTNTLTPQTGSDTGWPTHTITPAANSSWHEIKNVSPLYLNAMIMNGFYILGGSGTTATAHPPDKTMYASHNSGSSWKSQSNGVSNTYVWSLFKSGSTIFSGTDKGIFRSTDNGQNWSAANNGIESAGKGGQISFAVQNNKIFTGNPYWGVAVSSDNGTTWTESNNGLPDHGTTHGVLALLCTGTTLLAGTTEGCFKSTDGGSTWKLVDLITQTANGTNNSTFTQALALMGTKNFAAPNNRGVAVSNDHGDTWVPSSNGLDNTDIKKFLVNGSTVYALSSRNGIFVSKDGGVNWTAMNDGLPDPLIGINDIVVSGNVMIASSTWGVLYNYSL